MAVFDPIALVGAAWSADVEKWHDDKDQANHDSSAAVQSQKALQDTYSDLWPMKVRLWEGLDLPADFDSRRALQLPAGRYPMVSVEVTAGFVEVFQKHAPTLACCRYQLPEGKTLDSVVDSLRRPVALNKLYNIVATAMANIFKLVCEMGQKLGAIEKMLLPTLDHKILEMRRLCICMRCTCSQYRFLGR